MADHWNAELARPLPLRTGRTLTTLRDASDCLTVMFATVLHSGELEQAITLLLTAAETGKSADIAAATVQLQRVLHERQVLERRQHPR